MTKQHKQTNEFGDSVEVQIDESKIEEVLENTEVSDDLLTKNAELEDLLKRKAAEFENYKKRTDKEKIALLEFGAERIFKKFVDLLDDIRNANESAKNTTDMDIIIKGVDMILQKTEKLFADEGVTIIPTKIGDKFDVNIHEALMSQVSADIPEDHITMILQNGYSFKDKIIRHTKVATSSGQQ